MNSDAAKGNGLIQSADWERAIFLNEEKWEPITSYRALEHIRRRMHNIDGMAEYFLAGNTIEVGETRYRISRQWLGTLTKGDES